jgi:uncharacterized protein (TIGR02145 family)
MTKYLIFLLVFSTAVSSCTKDDNLKTVTIGKQVWMTRNLSSSRFRNGDPIAQASTREEWIKFAEEKKPAWCYPGNDQDNEKKYGKLYNWYAVVDPRGIAPAGWHVPSDDEWKQLTDYLGGEIPAAYILRETGLETQAPAFEGVAGGGCKLDGTCFGFGSNGNWWTSTSANEEFAWMRQLNFIQCAISSITVSKQAGFSVRCVKN